MFLRQWLKKSKRLIIYGKFQKRVILFVENNQYQIDLYTFKDSIDSYRYYRKVIFDYSKKSGLINSKYDLYDWSFTYFQFEGYTFRVTRYGNTLECLKSKNSVPIDNVEMDAAEIIKALAV